MAGMDGPLSVVNWKELMAYPEMLMNLLYRKPNGDITYDCNKITVISDKKMSLLRANTLEELYILKDTLLSKPILMTVKAWRNVTHRYPFRKVTVMWRNTFGLLINTKHSMIRHVIDSQIELASQALQEGDNYCVELDFEPVIASWYAQVVDPTRLGIGGCKSARLFITNYSKYQHFFDCNVIWCLFCAPCWFLSAPCYKIHRNHNCQDTCYKFSDVPLTVITRPILGSGGQSEAGVHLFIELLRRNLAQNNSH